MKQKCSGAIYRANRGKVYLTGAGPGDPELISLKGINCLKKAGVVIYDRLINPQLLGYAPKAAQIIYAGKSPRKHTLTQEEINSLLARKAREGKNVVRLKCGDPFVFGRGAEEALFLAKHKIPFEVVPGISSATAVPAFAGIPLTHRAYTSSIGIFTGHEDNNKTSSGIDWEKISCGLGTLVFLMGVENISRITRNLIKSGRSRSTPCCLVQDGTSSGQKSAFGNLATIFHKAREAGIRPPAILVVGEVCALRKRLNWFEGRPLFGKKILITRPKGEDNRFTQILEEHGAECAELPAIAIKPLTDYSRLDAAIKKISGFQWLVFSSRSGVKFFRRRFGCLNRNKDALDKIKIAAIGPGTALALEDEGLNTSLLPDKFCQEGLLASFGKLKLKGQNILIVHALEARDVLSRGLERMGAKVTVAPAYQTDPGPRTPDPGPRAFDIITFTSSLAAKSFSESFSKKSLKAALKNTLIASIGPITSQAIKEAGLKVNIEAGEYTLEGLARAIVKYYKNR